MLPHLKEGFKIFLPPQYLITLSEIKRKQFYFFAIFAHFRKSDIMLLQNLD